jgi:hypothetical protein
MSDGGNIAALSSIPKGNMDSSSLNHQKAPPKLMRLGIWVGYGLCGHWAAKTTLDGSWVFTGGVWYHVTPSN